MGVVRVNLNLWQILGFIGEDSRGRLSLRGEGGFKRYLTHIFWESLPQSPLATAPPSGGAKGVGGFIAMYNEIRYSKRVVMGTDPYGVKDYIVALMIINIFIPPSSPMGESTSL